MKGKTLLIQKSFYAEKRSFPLQFLFEKPMYLSSEFIHFYLSIPKQLETCSCNRQKSPPRGLHRRRHGRGQTFPPGLAFLWRIRRCLLRTPPCLRNRSFRSRHNRCRRGGPQAGPSQGSRRSRCTAEKKKQDNRTNNIGFCVQAPSGDDG